MWKSYLGKEKRSAHSFEAHLTCDPRQSADVETAQSAFVENRT